MADSVTLTVRLPSRTKDQLAALAGRTRGTSSFLAAEAIADYGARELAIVEAIERGRADVRAGRFTPHTGVARETHAMIAAARLKRLVVWASSASDGADNRSRIAGTGT